MLQLLLERGQSYEDIASLLGGSRDDVRRRARAALEGLGGADPDAEVGLTDYLLGQADPIGRADAVRHLQSDPEALALAEELAAKLRLIAPQAQLPDLPQPRKRRRPPAPLAADGGDAPTRRMDAPASTAGEGARSWIAGLSPRQARLFAAIGAGSLILLFAILAIAGAFDGGDEPATEAAGAQTADGDVVTEDITTVTLRPTEGGGASGEARFGIANESQPFVELRLGGLEQPPEGQTYVVWFLPSEERGYPLAPLVGVTEDGTFQERFPIPQSAIAIAVQTQFVDVGLVDNRELAGDIQKALEGEDVLLPYQGQSVLRGRIPRLEEPPPNPDLESGGGGTAPDSGGAETTTP
jgi:hypothetical protein